MKTTSREAKCERLDAANQLLETIAGCGRHFFAHHGKHSSFEIDVRGYLWWCDTATGRRIYLINGGRWRYFHEGGTLRKLVEALCNFIRSGTHLNPQRFGPWPDWMADGGPWGYGENMTIVRAKAEELGIVSRGGVPA